MLRTAPRHAAGIASLVVQKTDPRFLQDFLSFKFALTRRAAKAVIDGRSVWVNRKCVWIARYAVKTGDVVEVPQNVVKAAQRQAKSSETGSPRPEARSETARRHVRVLWQNENYLVCDKPAGVVSCDDPKSVEAILREQEGVPTLEAVHRLDRDTTGCLLFAKSRAALEAAIEVFKTHKVSKVYHAIAVGKLEYAHMTVNAELDGKDASRRQGVRAQERARPAPHAGAAADASCVDPDARGPDGEEEPDTRAFPASGRLPRRAPPLRHGQVSLSDRLASLCLVDFGGVDLV